MFEWLLRVASLPTALGPEALLPQSQHILYNGSAGRRKENWPKATRPDHYICQELAWLASSPCKRLTRFQKSASKPSVSMANALRILFVSGEVTPFTAATEIAQLVRTLPEQLHESGKYEIRIMMPRYGIISERRNRLHEVIRLSGSEIQVNDEPQTLKVKVASIPGIRLQVYFMDNAHYFKRKGVIAGKDGVVFEDNAERALYFTKSAFETIKNLGWQPDVVHGFGWASAFAPLLLSSGSDSDPLFENTKTVFTPDLSDPKANLTKKLCATLGLPAETVGKSLDEVGAAYSDAIIQPPSGKGDGPIFSLDPEEMLATASEVYEQLVGVAV